ncbi:hypothetical protein V2J09_020690 [Rumex salicifolius]
MAISKKMAQATIAVALILMSLAGESLAALQVGFYKGKCGKNDVEQIVFNVIKAEFAKDPTLVAALLRLQFHDCFVRGCDASILLDGGNTEKTAGPNGSVRGYEVIDTVKSALENLCPGVVSCSDIITIAARVTVVLAKGTWYNVETGRRDGMVSLASDANSNLPGPATPVSSAVNIFAAKGISKEDFVLLLGAHTVGIAHCSLFQDRLYNFQGNGGKDPSIHGGFAKKLMGTCPKNGDGSNSVFLDQSSVRSANLMGNGFYFAIKKNKGILQIDQDIALDSSTSPIVDKYAANNSLFNAKFGEAMVKMGRIGALTGSQGQIRKSMATSKKMSQATIAVALVLMTLAGQSLAALQFGFYKNKCGKNDVEQIVFNLIKAEFAKDPTLVAALLRLQFHDCFVRGCDASILLDGGNTEKTAPPNGSVRGYEVIDRVKAALENLCPGVVSCSDIITIAARATVVLAKGTWYNVETGRRDGLVSLASDANSDLPGPATPVSSAVNIFAAKGISKEDFELTLLELHIVHCSKTVSTTSMETAGKTQAYMELMDTCPKNGDGSNSVFLDQSSVRSANLMGNGFFFAIKKNKGILQIDQDIALDSSTSPIVDKYAANNALFNAKFGEAMIKMGRIGVLTGSQGQIRKSCRSLN